MGHKFERVAMENLPDGSVNIGISIVATLGATDEPDPAFTSSCQWARCAEAHTHDWATCNINALFRTRQKNAQGADIVGSSLKEQLIAWLQARIAEVGRPKRVELPTRRITRDGQDVDVPDRDVAL